MGGGIDEFVCSTYRNSDALLNTSYKIQWNRDLRDCGNSSWTVKMQTVPELAY